MEDVDWRNRTHFLALSSRLIRRILVDLARARTTGKRGGDLVRVTFDEALAESRDAAENVVRVHDALEAMAVFDERKSRVVELKFFGGLTVEEIATLLQVSSKTVLRDWELARSWLYREMGRERDRDS